MIETYDVVGMTCDHCVRAVTAEVSELDGVTDVDVDLATGTLRLTTDQQVPVTKVAEAVEEAGYTLHL
jgi:copper chaperone